MISFQVLCQLLALFCCTLFAGAAVYITFVEHPARMECGTELAATVFPVSYHKATVMQASLAALGFITAVAAWIAGSSLWWLVGGVLLGSVIPFTLIVILPTNKQLTDPNLDRGSAFTHQLLTRWGRLHAVRSVVSVAALVIFLVCG